VARLSTTKASKRHAACSDGRSGLPRARALSKVALSGVVVVGVLGTTSMAQSKRGSSDSTRARQRGCRYKNVYSMYNMLGGLAGVHVSRELETPRPQNVG
jgi:hypothetical protein